MIQEDQFKFLIESRLRERLDAVFDAQGLTAKEGMRRLIEFLLEQPAELHPLILRQLPGRSADFVARAYLDNASMKKPGHPVPAAGPRAGGARKRP